MGKMEDVLKSPLERDRLSGRTTRMFEAAQKEALAGTKVLVLMKDNMHAASAKYHYPWHPAMVAKSYRTVPEVDWKNLDKVTHNGVEYKLFIDHDVFHTAFGHILKGFHAYDISFDDLSLEERHVRTRGVDKKPA